MKTWKKIDETKKRTTDINNLKKRNEERLQKVRINILVKYTIENNGPANESRKC